MFGLKGEIFKIFHELKKSPNPISIIEKLAKVSKRASVIET